MNGGVMYIIILLSLLYYTAVVEICPCRNTGNTGGKCCVDAHQSWVKALCTRYTRAPNRWNL